MFSRATTVLSCQAFHSQPEKSGHEAPLRRLLPAHVCYCLGHRLL